jgi:hypothetical protein
MGNTPGLKTRGSKWGVGEQGVDERPEWISGRAAEDVPGQGDGDDIA